MGGRQKARAGAPAPLVAVVLVAALFLPACSFGSDTVEVSGPTVPGEATDELPPPDLAGLAPIFDPAVAPLGLRVARAALVDVDSRKPDPQGRHLAIYVEPTEAWDDARFVSTIVPLTRVFAPSIFERWPDLASFDVCQEPSPGVDDRPEPEPLSQVELSAEVSASIPWDRANLATLAVAAARQRSGAGLAVADRLESDPTLKAAVVEARSELDEEGRGGAPL